MAQLAPLLQNQGANFTLDEATSKQLITLSVLFDYFKLFEKVNTGMLMKIWNCLHNLIVNIIIVI